MKMKATLKLLDSSFQLRAEPFHTHALPIRAHTDTRAQGVCVPVLRAHPAFFPPLVLLVNIKSHPMNSYLLQEQIQILVTQTQLSVGHTLLLNERLKPVSPG